MGVFQERLKLLRGQRTQKEVVDDIYAKYNKEIPLANYANWERKSMPKADDLIILANYFDVTLDYLFGRDEYSCRACADFGETFGLTDKAIRGIQCIQDCSSKNNNRMAALNFLLEKEVERHSTEQYMFHEILSLISNKNLYCDPDLSDLNVSDKDKALINFLKRETIHLIFAKNAPLMLMAWRSQFQAVRGERDEIKG